MNRLTKEDTLEWDKAFENFYKTGVWKMADKPTDKEGTPIDVKTHSKGIETHGLMANPNRTGRFPGSRDWDLEARIPCANKKCMCHNQTFDKGVCGVPSRCAINNHGKCEGFKPRKAKNNG